MYISKPLKSFQCPYLPHLPPTPPTSPPTLSCRRHYRILRQVGSQVYFNCFSVKVLFIYYAQLWEAFVDSSNCVADTRYSVSIRVAKLRQQDMITLFMKHMCVISTRYSVFIRVAKLRYQDMITLFMKHMCVISTRYSVSIQVGSKAALLGHDNPFHETHVCYQHMLFHLHTGRQQSCVIRT